MTRKRSLAILLVLLILPGAGVVIADQVVRNGIVAIVNDSVITLQELDIYVGKVLRPGFNDNSATYRNRRREARKDGLEQLIDRQLILHDFQNLGGVLNESLIDDEIRDRIRQRYGDRARLTKTLQEQGMTFEGFRQRTREDIIIRFMQNRNINDGIVISPSKIERYYQNHLNDYQVEDQVKLRMIVINRTSGTAVSEVFRLIQEVRFKINEGAEFSEMAAIYSDGAFGPKGGLAGWVGERRSGVGDVAFKLKKGEMSNILAKSRVSDGFYWIYQYDEAGQIAVALKYTENDEFVEEQTFAENPDAAKALLYPREFYLLKVEDRRAAHTKPLEDVRDEIEKELEIAERSRQREKWIDRLEKESFVARYY